MEGLTPSPKPEPEEEKLKFGLWPLPLIFDFSLRWVSHFLYSSAIIAGWLFWLLQLFAIPVLLIMVLAPRHERIKATFGLKLDRSVDVVAGRYGVALVALLIAAGTYYAQAIVPGWPWWGRAIAGLVGFALYGLYVGSIYMLSPTKSRAEVDHELEDRDPLDQNDVAIIRLETDLASQTQRIDSYMLESAFIGALAFSGFLSLMASERQILESASLLARGVLDCADLVARGDLATVPEILLLHAIPNELMAGIAIETLVCSMFFLSVIVSRVRFFDAARQVEFAVRLARSFNEKEESVSCVLLEDEANVAATKRLEHVTRESGLAIEHAGTALSELRRAANYLWLFRNLGVLSFLIVLVNSAFLISRTLAVLFVAVATIAFLYTKLERVSRDRRTKSLPFFSGLVAKVQGRAHGHRF